MPCTALEGQGNPFGLLHNSALMRVFPWEASPELFFFQCQSDDLSRSVPLIKSVSSFSTFSTVFIRDEVCPVGFVCNKINLVKLNYGIIHTLSLLLGTFLNNKKTVKIWLSEKLNVLNYTVLHFMVKLPQCNSGKYFQTGLHFSALPEM